MNASVVFVLAFGLLAVASALPVVNDVEPEEVNAVLPENIPLPISEERGLRFRRVTCDLGSISLPIGSLNHSACAAHCLAKRKGFKGGRCKDGVCHCRK